MSVREQQQRQRCQMQRIYDALGTRPRSPPRLHTEPERTPVVRCGECAGMPWRRVDFCTTCGEPEAPERDLDRTVAVGSPSALAMAAGEE